MAFKEQAKKIESDYEELIKQCKDPAKMKEIKLDEIVVVMEHMVKNFTKPNGNVFAKGFLGHLCVISELAVDDNILLVDHFGDITRLLCEMCSKTDLDWEFLSNMLVHWTKFVSKLSCTARNVIFRTFKTTAFVHCAQFLINAPCYSLKLQMLNILCVYLAIDAIPMIKMSALFDGIAAKRTMKFIKSIKWNADEKNLSLSDKYRIIERINHMKRSIYSELVDTFEFGNSGKKITFERNNGRLFFNKLTKTIEFYVTHNSSMILATISARKMQNVQVTDSGNCFVENLKLILRAPPRFESMNGKQIEVPEFQVTTIDVNFYTGIMKYRLDSLLMDMFEIVPETLKSSIANVSTDSDIEMIELSPERSKFRRSTRARSVSRSQQQQPQQQPTKKTRAKRTIPKQPDPVIKPTTNRSQRTAAKKAKQGITKSLEEESIYDFEDLDAIHPSSRTGSKRNNKPRSPSPISKFIGLGSKNKNTKTVVKARKLYSQKQNEMELNNNSSDVDGDDDDDTKKSPKTRRPIEIADVELTPTGFRKSIFKDPEVQKRHMLENASRINEDIKRISEPKRLTNSTKTNDLSGDIKGMKIQQDDTEQSTEGENTDKNSKRKRCACQLLEAELINIGNLSRQALVTLRSNDYVCKKCGGTTQLNSQ